MTRRPFMTAASRLALPAILMAAAAVMLSAPAGAEQETCEESLYVYDPHGLVWDTGVSVDFSTAMDVESLVDDYTSRIDDALDAESEGSEPPDGVSSDELIDEAQWEVEDAVEWGRSIAGCEE